ncbi:bacteriochlorophyll 4-vinyl reductase [Piscinibacter sakaiensis]|uniref:Protein BchJ n=1 Tax=Piscinibacter sakaiensis TaxID=1547922 RepID=A0A0K8P7L0_PISS1|nr:bacteriochlorophyll 4-vinyl reductase [Piscinibacter sakaiensis]GAP38617.1 protein BchJ [Piscinibacter sakaiensis]
MSAATGTRRGGGSAPPRDRIGPNAITRLAEALVGHGGPALAAEVFGQAGLARHLRRPPDTMVPEDEACRLHAALRERLGAQAPALARAAGTATADYLLAHRIPRPVQALLRWLPAPLAARGLLAAMRGHAWTFAGSGRFEAAAGSGGRATLTIRGNPLCRGQLALAPACDYYAATFERLFRVLVHPDCRVAEVACEARGDTACRFEVTREAPPKIRA